MTWLTDHDASTRPAWSLMVFCCVAVFLFVSPADASRDLADLLAPTIAGPVAGPADLDRNSLVRSQLPLFSAADILALSYGYDSPDQLLLLTNGRSSGGHRLFQGLWHDPLTGIAYARNRWYDARTAHWLSPDPMGAFDSPNQYAFVAWGPERYTDPTGELIGFVFDGGFAIYDTYQYKTGQISGSEYAGRMALTGASVAANLSTGGLGGMVVRAASTGSRIAKGVNTGLRVARAVNRSEDAYNFAQAGISAYDAYSTGETTRF